MSRMRAFLAAAALGVASLTIVGQVAGPAGAETFPGPGGRIAYTSGGIWTMDPDGSDKRFLGGGTWANWSPDGHKIAYGYVAQGEYVESLWVMNADGSNQRRVYGGGLVAIATNPSWSPDGSEIAFSRREYFRNGSFYDLRDPEIAVIKPDGTGLRTVSGSPAYDEFPEWSPDGSTIVYQSAINPGPTSIDINYDIYAVAADGSSAPVQLTSDPGWEERPSWSPDGSTIVYERWAVANTNSELWLMDADGSNQRVLPRTGLGSMWMPTFSTDGTLVYFSLHDGNSGGNWDIASIATSGGTPTLLGATAATEWAPAQQSDSTPPTITCDATPTFTRGQTGAEVTATVADDPGGIGVDTTSVSAPVSTSTVGSFTAAAFTASDQAGNAATPVGCTYDVVAPAISGVLAPPVDPQPALNKAKAGRVVPIKFRVVDADGAPVLGLTDAVVRTTNLACGGSALSDAVEEYVASSGFREQGDGWYQWNWASPSGYAGSCRTLTVEIGGSAVVSADFTFVR